MHKFKVAGIGELLWDMLPQGKQLGGVRHVILPTTRFMQVVSLS